MGDGRRAERALLLLLLCVCAGIRALKMEGDSPTLSTSLHDARLRANRSSAIGQVKEAVDQAHPSNTHSKADNLDGDHEELEENPDWGHPEVASPHAPAHKSHGVKVASFKFEYVKAELVVCGFIVLIGIFKLVYHQLTFPRNILPESCCLIALGCCIGGFIRFVAGGASAEAVRFLEFDSKIFFFFLLPPIILEAAYDLNDKAFVDNFGTIVLYAVVGTVLNIALIGGALIFCGFLGIFGTFGIHALDCLVFASLIAAVDPVAVLAIFKEVGVNKMLYFMVFGESLLNDAVTVVCYNLIGEFKDLETIRLYDCFLGFLAFLCVSIGGLLIGLVCGALSTFITRFTLHVRVVEPVVCFGMAYLSYVLSELFHFSGIIGIISCGLFQTHYTMNNLSSKSYISINYITKVVSSVSESLIFIILGVMILNENSFWFDDWHPPFAIAALIFCIVARCIVVFVLTYIVNRFTGGVRYISFQEQVIMAYGGLRGAVSFSLAFMIDNQVQTKPTLLAATYLVILFTVFVQGSTMKSLVKVLNISLAHKDNSYRLFIEFNKGLVNHMTQGVEDIIGAKNQTVMQKLRQMSSRYLRPLLVRGYKEKNTEQKLIMIENEENLKETLKSVPSTASFKRQQTIDEMTEAGQFDVELCDEYDELMEKRNKAIEETDKEVEELMNHPLHIQALVNQTYYPDRNLVDEELHERRASLSAGRHSNHRHQVDRIANLSLREPEIRRRRGLLRGKTKKKVSVTRGMVAAAATSLGVSSHVHHPPPDVILEVDETGSETSSPPATARSIKTPTRVFGTFAPANGVAETEERPKTAKPILYLQDSIHPDDEPDRDTNRD